MKTTLKSGIPKKMNALILTAFNGKPILKEIDVPLPGKGEVLVKIDSSPINPSDWSFIRGLYSSKKTLPVVPGFEGSGTVVATGNDFFSRRLLGKKIACFAPPDGDGTWAEFMLTKYTYAIALKKDFDIEQASMLLVNPLSVLAMVKILKGKGYASMANTAAASALGQMLNKICIEENIKLVNIVRRDEQVEILKGQGSKYIINSSSGNFINELKDIFTKQKVKLAFDAIGGQSTFDLLEGLPRGGEVILYGGLSEKAVSANPARFIFEKKKLSGFWLSEWITHQNIFKLLMYFSKIQKFLTDKYQINIQERVSLENATDGINLYVDNMSSGKVLIKPWLK